MRTGFTASDVSQDTRGRGGREGEGEGEGERGRLRLGDQKTPHLGTSGYTLYMYACNVHVHVV